MTGLAPKTWRARRVDRKGRAACSGPKSLSAVPSDRLAGHLTGCSHRPRPRPSHGQAWVRGRGLTVSQWSAAARAGRDAVGRTVWAEWQKSRAEFGSPACSLARCSSPARFWPLSPLEWCTRASVESWLRAVSSTKPSGCMAGQAKTGVAATRLACAHHLIFNPCRTSASSCRRFVIACVAASAGEFNRAGSTGATALTDGCQDTVFVDHCADGVLPRRWAG